MDACNKTKSVIWRWLATLLLATFCIPSIDAANFRTQNFIVDAQSPQMAESVGRAAELFREELAVYWTGRPLPPWPQPCPIRVVAGNIPAQGVTTYNPAPVRDFQMEVIGTPERILDSVLPHEVTHTVLATHFGRPLPRWADEGICTTVEHESEKAKHEAKLREFLSTRRGIAMNQLFLLTEYPPDVLPMYAQGYSVCRFLIDQKGPRVFIDFLHDYMQSPSWTVNIQKHYDYDSLAELQTFWLRWVEAGSGSVTQFVKTNPRNQDTPQDVAPVQSIASRDRTIPGRLASSRSNQPIQGSSSWYGRGEASRQPPMAIEQLGPPPAAQPAATASTQSTQPRWAPPSVRSSGVYSVATPQGESSGSLPSGSWR